MSERKAKKAVKDAQAEKANRTKRCSIKSRFCMRAAVQQHSDRLYHTRENHSLTLRIQPSGLVPLCSSLTLGNLEQYTGAKDACRGNSATILTVKYVKITSKMRNHGTAEIVLTPPIIELDSPALSLQAANANFENLTHPLPPAAAALRRGPRIDPGDILDTGSSRKS